MAKKNVIDLNSEKILCIKCGKTKNGNSFYKSKNNLLGEKVNICKMCIKDYINYDDLETIQDIFRLLNVPYIRETWLTSAESDKDTLSEYIRKVNSLPHLKELTYRNSDTFGAKTQEVEIANIKNGYQFELTEEILDRWGKGFDNDAYEKLEKIYSEIIKSFESENYTQKTIHKNIAKTQLKADKALAEDRISDYDKLMKTISTLMQDGNMKPSQKNSGDGVSNSISDIIKMMENESPIMDDEYEEKEMSKYFTKYVREPILKSIGLGVDDNGTP